MKIPFWDRHTYEQESFICILRKIKEGDKFLKNKFISDYRPFILKSISQLSGKFIDVENSEEYSVGLLAFNEAIDSYNEDKKCSFVKFSQQVIKRRLIDYKRSTSKNSKVLPFSYFESTKNVDFEERYMEAASPDHIYNFEVREEFKSFVVKLKEYDMSLHDLVSSTPKHKDTRSMCIKIAKIISGDNELYTKMNLKKTIPFKDLMKNIDVSQRTVERNRRYIIALTLIIKSELEVLKNYIKNLE